jgi:prolyl oligopeptidase
MTIFGSTTGKYWVPEYGDPDSSAEMFRALLAYSPVHNCRPTDYPATLIMTADHDDRVHPANSFKFAAALQAAQTGPAPILLRVETKAGHGAGKPTSKVIDEQADVFAFVLRAVNNEA